MARDRIIYQSENIFTSTIGGNSTNIAQGKIKEINRVQDMSYNLEVSRTDVNEFGQLAALSREVTDPPTVSLDFSYLITDGTQEKNLGFEVNAGALPQVNAVPLTKSLLDPTSTGSSHGANADELNYYIVTTSEGNDLHSTTNNIKSANNGVIAIGNGFITSYAISASVGEFASASVSVEASNMLFKDNMSAAFSNPAIDVNSSTGAKFSGSTVDFGTLKSSDGDITVGGNEIFAIRPGDIEIDFDATGYFATQGTVSPVGKLDVGGPVLPGSGFGSGTKTPVHLQSVSLDVPVSRTPMTKLGAHFPFARKIDFPVNMSLSVSALMTDIDDGSLDDLICNAEQKRDIAIRMKDRCGNNQVITYVMRNAILDSESFSASIGDNKTVDLTFSAQVGGANDSSNGIFAFTGVTSNPASFDTPTKTP